MPTAYPAALDAYSDPAGAVTQGSTTPAHSGHHKNHNDAIEALEAKLGIGATVAAANQVLTGTGAGQTAYGQVATAMLATGAVSQSGGSAPTASQTTTSTSPVAMTGSTVTLTIGATGFVLFTATGTVKHDTANGLVFVYAAVDGVSLGQYTIAQVPTASGFAPFSLALALVASAGSHAFTLQWQVLSGTATLQAAGMTVVELKK